LTVATASYRFASRVMEAQVALVRLVNMGYRHAGQPGVDARLQGVALGDRAHDLAQGGAVSALLLAVAWLADQVGAARPDRDLVGRAAVLGLVDGEVTLVDQRLAGPTDGERERDALARDLSAPSLSSRHTSSLSASSPRHSVSVRLMSLASSVGVISRPPSLMQ